MRYGTGKNVTTTHINFPQVRGRKSYSYHPLPMWWNIYMSIHSLIALFAYESISLFRNVSIQFTHILKILLIQCFFQRMSPLAVFCHIFYVIFSITTMGLFYDNNLLAPFIEFARCIFLMVYSNGSINLLTNSLNWSGLAEVFSGSVEIQIYFFLRTYFVFSTFIWSLITIHNIITILKTTKKIN